MSHARPSDPRGESAVAPKPTELATDFKPTRTLSRSIDAITVRPTAALVGFDQRASQRLLDRREIAHQSTAAFAQGNSG
jgi:hypothetical protein